MEANAAAIVGRTFGGMSDWKSTLRHVLDLPESLDESIKTLWRTQPVGTDPLTFALAVSDENFLPLIDAM